MKLYWVDTRKDGNYTDGSVMPYASRRQAAEQQSFDIAHVSTWGYHVRRRGGDAHTTYVGRFYNTIYCDCDCYDFLNYGREFQRACQHVWKVYLTYNI